MTSFEDDIACTAYAGKLIGETQPNAAEHLGFILPFLVAPRVWYMSYPTSTQVCTRRKLAICTRRESLAKYRVLCASALLISVR